MVMAPTTRVIEEQKNTILPSVPRGFKQTDMGVMPEDWQVVPMGDLFTFQNGVNADKSAYGKGTQFINVLEVITNSTLDERKIPGRIMLPAQAVNIFGVQHGDVLFNRTSETQEEVGLASVYIGHDNVVFGGFVIRGRPRDKRLETFFTSYVLRSPHVRAQIISRGQGAVRANIGQQELCRIRLFLPCKAEQEAIAEALSDADALIEGLEQLIAKKRHLKQGAMQELLTGKTRLPGFSGDWEVKLLGEIGHIKTGGRNNQDKVDDGEYPLFVRSDKVERINSYCYDCEAILVPGEGGIGSIFHYIVGRFDVHQRVYAINQFSPRVSGKFIFFYMVMNFGAHAMRNSVKATVDSLRLPTFQNFDVMMPPSADEQTAIAAILSDMDAEIAALEAKLAKARQIKQGMMQKLLTGRVRLI